MGNIPHTIAFETSLMDSKGEKNENQNFTHYYFGTDLADDSLPGISRGEYN